MKSQMPSYIDLYHSGRLKEIFDELREKMEPCTICPHNCSVARLKGQTGRCKTGSLAKTASYSPHHGEEKPLSGSKGSGTIFFSECSLRCVFCQNYDISQLGYGKQVFAEELSDMMIKLQDAGCHNINFVSPTHVICQIIEALIIAVKKGLNIPLVYNTGGYDSEDTLKIVNGVFDIYMPDMKYSDSMNGVKYSGIKNYPLINMQAVRQMHSQVGDLILDENGIAVKGLLVRILILPGNMAGIGKTARFLAENISKDTYINLLTQYYPGYNAKRYPELSRRITMDEFNDAMAIAKSAGLHRFDRY